MIRRRLLDRCGLICSGVDNDYMQQGRDLVGDLEGIARSVIHHVESYSSRPTRNEEYPRYHGYHAVSYTHLTLPTKRIV